MSQQQQSISDDIYSALILEEAEKLYNNLATKLVNEVMAAAAIKASSLPLSLPSNNSQKLNYENDA
jgi:CRISPR/Cas system CSM-associated protein Csm4 (group 5 of RAMP superfamily)